MTIRIRAADDDDDLILDLQKTILPNDEPLPPDEKTWWWIAWDGDTPVAFAALSASSQYLNGGYLSRAGVLTSHRGLGLQKRLIKVRVRAAKRLGWDVLVTDTVAENAPSINSLIACGFRAYVPTHPWGFARAVYWRRRLQVLNFSNST